jgi:hypothetical protein
MDEVTNKKPYTFRKLQATDIAPMAAVISKIGIDQFTDCFASTGDLAKIFRDKTKTKEAITNIAGMKIAFKVANIVLAHYGECQNDIFALLADVSGLTVKEISEMSPATFAKMLIDFIKMDDFADFFKVALELLN